MTPEVCVGAQLQEFFIFFLMFFMLPIVSTTNTLLLNQKQTNKQKLALQREGKKGSVWVPLPVAGGDTPVRSVPKASLSLIQVSATAPQDMAPPLLRWVAPGSSLCVFSLRCPDCRMRWHPASCRVMRMHRSAGHRTSRQEQHNVAPTL